MESIGNDFVLVHESDVVKHAGDLSAFYRDLATEASRRKFGVGSDGLLAVSLIPGGNLKLRMFNPDGTEDFCGNGLRCAAVHAKGQGWIAERFTTEHLGRSIPTSILGEDVVETMLGKATYEPIMVPTSLDREAFDAEICTDGPSLRGSALSTGSTHVVLWVKRLPDDALFLEVSPKLEHDKRFPERTSVMWAHENAPNSVEIRIWERGAGETLGCGTGAAAVAIDYLRRKDASGEVRVKSKGGEVTISADSWDSTLTARASAKELFEGEYLMSGNLAGTIPPR